MCSRVGAILQADPIGQGETYHSVSMQANKLQKSAVAIVDGSIEIEENDADWRLVIKPVQAARQAVPALRALTR